MKCLFIYNPKSGKGKILNKIKYIVKVLHKKFEVVDVHETQSANDVTEFTKVNAHKYDAIVFSGGDGTFNEVTTGIASLEKRPILGYIPSGTANDIARNLKISRNVRKSLKNIIRGYTIFHDVGRINDKYFIYVAGIGACTGTSYTTKHEAKKLLGRLAYLKHGIDEFFNAPVSEVKYSSEELKIEMKAPLLLIMNSKSVGGISFNRYGHLNDGFFDVIMVKDDVTRGRINVLKTFIYGLFGAKIKKHALFFRSDKFRVDVKEDVVWCIDGEEGPKGSVEIENLKGHLEIYVPKKKINLILKREKKNV